MIYVNQFKLSGPTQIICVVGVHKPVQSTTTRFWTGSNQVVNRFNLQSVWCASTSSLLIAWRSSLLLSLLERSRVSVSLLSCQQLSLNTTLFSFSRSADSKQLLSDSLKTHRGGSRTPKPLAIFPGESIETHDMCLFVCKFNLLG